MVSECRNCKHWNNPGGRTKVGKCILSKSKHPMMFSGCGLYTREDFGCKLFEENKTIT